MQRKDLEGLSREELIVRAEAAGVARPRTLTIPELIDEILQSAQHRPGDKRGRGWFGRARDLLTSVIDRGLNPPEPRSRRSDGRAAPPAPPPLPTATLAEIYAAQGHLERALTTLDEVLAREPNHADAKALRAKFAAQLQKTKPSSPPPVVEAKLEPMPAPATPRIDRPSSDRPISASREEAPAASPPAVAASAAEGKSGEAPVEPAKRARRSDIPPAPALEVDEIVGIAVDPNTVYLYWEVKPTTLAHARAANADGALVIRAVTVRPSLAGPATEVRDFRVDALFGELFVHALPAEANVRVSVGYKSGAAFEPFAVGLDSTTPRDAPATDVARTFRRWSEAGQPMAAAFGDPVRRALDVQRQRAFTDFAPESEGLLTRFPAGVWVEPSRRVVRVGDAATGEVSEPNERGEREVVTTQRSNVPGSSDLVRRRAVWASDPSARIAR